MPGRPYDDRMNEGLPAFIDEAEAIAADARRVFGQLSAEQLNWKPSAESWSIAQCFEHLIVINSDYFPILEKVANGEHRPTGKERLPLLPRLFGRLILSAVQPSATRKVKTNQKYQPSKSGIGANIVDRFEAHQRQVIQYMVRTGKVDQNTVIITSPVASIATYSVADAYRILLAHERRHLQQAERLMTLPGFP